MFKQQFFIFQQTKKEEINKEQDIVQQAIEFAKIEFLSVDEIGQILDLPDQSPSKKPKIVSQIKYIIATIIKSCLVE